MKIRPHAGLNRALRILLKISIGLCATGVLACLYAAYSYWTLPAHVDPATEILPSDIVMTILVFVQLPLTFISVIVFFWWIYRTNKNLGELTQRLLTFTPAWSVAWFFIPIASLWKPYQVVKELWLVSHGDEENSASAIGWWWGLYLLSNAAQRLANEIELGATASDYAVSYLLSAVVLYGVDIAVNVALLMVVTGIGAAYARNIVEPARIAYDGPAGAAPLSLA